MSGSQALLLHDLRAAARGLTRRPGGPILAVIVLSLGIGANTAVFSLVDAVLFRPLPVERPEELARLLSASSPRGTEAGRVSQPFVEDYRAAARSLGSLETWSDGLPVDVAVEGRSAERLSAAVASPGFFQCLAIRPAIGRLLGADDHGSEAGVVLSHRLWTRSFDRDPLAVGALVHVNRRPFVVVGVAPEGFEGIGLETLPDLWLPLSELPAAMPAWRDQVGYRSSTFFHAIGRLAPGADLRSARAELAVIGTGLGAGRPARAGPEAGDPDWREPWAWLEPATTVAGRGSRAMALLLAGAVGLVLALAAADVAGLMLARAETRRRELGIRVALGASRWRVVRPLVLEALLLSFSGAVGGLLVARVSTAVLVAATATEVGLPLAARSGILSPRVLAVAAALATVATVLAGLWPALRVARADPLGTLRNDLPVGAARPLSARGALVALQVGVATVLLVGVGALLRSLWAAARVAPGVEADRVVAADLDLARGGYDKASGMAFASHLQEALGTTHPASPSALSVGAPLEGGPRTTVTVDGRAAPVDFTMVTPGYFETLGMALTRGRGIERADGPDATSVAVVNQAFARRFWPDRDPIGRHIGDFAPRAASLVVVGVVSDVRTHGLREPTHPVLYVPLAQFYEAFPWQFGLTAIIRTPGVSQAPSAALEGSVHAVDPMLPVLRPRRLAVALGEPFERQRLLAGLLGGFAVLALVLAATGLYGVVSLTTAARTREFGVRLALGALPAHLRRAVYRRSLGLCGLGLAGGLAVALGASRALEPFVFGVSPTDSVTLAAVPAVLLLACVAAAEGPARRAAAADPAEALRHE